MLVSQPQEKLLKQALWQEEQQMQSPGSDEATEERNTAEERKEARMLSSGEKKQDAF